MKWVKFGVTRQFLENPLRKWPGICMLIHVSWTSSELSRLWLQFVDFSHFGTILTSWKGSNLGILVMLCGFSSWWRPFDWNWSYLGFLSIIWRICGSKCGRGGGGGGRSCVEFCLVTVIDPVRPEYFDFTTRTNGDRALYRPMCRQTYICLQIISLNL